ncbi:efflux RND transporter permease subunit [Pseudomonas aeruginosa]
MNAGVPLFIVVVLSLLMVQLRSFSRMAMVFLTAPLGLIGVTLFLLLFRQPFGFVAMLGTIALAGMIMRNSVILVDQIEQDISHGLDRWHAIIEATVRRFRPHRADRAGGGAGDDPAVAQRVLRADGGGDHGRADRRHRAHLLFLPALYAAWFRVKKDEARA